MRIAAIAVSSSERDPERIAKRLIAQLESLGHHAILEELPQVA